MSLFFRLSKKTFFALAVVSMLLTACSEKSTDSGDESFKRPVIEAFEGSVNENSTYNTFIGLVTVTEAGAGIASFTLNGEGVENFLVQGDGGSVIVANNAHLDYETKSVYDLTLFATDNTGQTSEIVSVTITLNNLYDLIPTLADFNGSVNNYALPGTVIGTLTFLEPGDSNITAVTLDDTDFSAATDGTLSVAQGASIDYDQQPLYTLHAYATNAAGNGMECNISITVNRLLTSELQTIYSSDIEANDYFGSVSVDGDYALIGAHGSTPTGAAYVFKRGSDGNFSKISKLLPSDGVEFDNFGAEVAMQGNYLVISAADSDTGPTHNDGGAVYVFKNNGSDSFSQIAKLVSDDIDDLDRFGYSVAIDGDFIAVGAVTKDYNATVERAGAAYVFKNNGSDAFTQVAKLLAEDAESNVSFGNAIAVDGNYVLVGANFEASIDEFGGAAYVYKNEGNDSYSQVAKLAGSDEDYGDHFGQYVAIDGNYLLVAAEGKDTTYVFKNDGTDTFDEIAKLASTGDAVAIDGEYVAAGTTGAVKLYHRTTDDKFIQQGLFTAKNAGASVSVSGNVVATGGSANDDVNGSYAGVAHMIRFSPLISQ